MYAAHFGDWLRNTCVPADKLKNTHYIYIHDTYQNKTCYTSKIIKIIYPTVMDLPRNALQLILVAPNHIGVNT